MNDSFLSSSPQDGPGWCTVAPLDLDRQTDQLVLASFHLREVQALDDPDPGFEERPVRLLAVLAEAAHREVVDADGPYPAVRQVAGRLLRDVDEILHEIFRRPAASRVLRLEQDPLAAPKPVRIELVRLYRFGVADLDNPCQPHRGLERHLVETLALPHEVEGPIHVGSGVGSHRDLRYISDVAVL